MSAELDARERRRGPAVLALVAALLALVAVDRSDRATSAGSPADDVFAMPVAAPVDALSSTWYCAAATANPGGMADGSVIVANPGDRDVDGTIRFVASDPGVQPVDVPIRVRTNERVVVTHHDHIQANWVAALVELRGGEVAVEHSVTGPLGADVAPCAAAASDRWYFADGGTTRDASAVLALFNPFPEDAIVDLSFSTDQGRVVPESLQAVVVPGRGLVAINLNDHVIRRRAISTTVATRSGRVVADRVQTYDGSGGRKGLALVLGAPSAGTTWYFPEGYLAPGTVERIQLYNPARRDARVEIVLGLEQGDAEPVLVDVPAEGRATVRMNDENRVPTGVPHSMTVVSDNGVPVVAERSVDAVAPAPRQGLASTLGARTTARRWVFAAGLVSPRLDEWVVLQNPGRRAARVSFVALAAGQPLPLAGLQDLDLPAGRRTGIRLGNHTQRGDLALLVTSTEPIVAERGLYRVGAVGISAVMGVPLRDRG